MSRQTTTIGWISLVVVLLGWLGIMGMRSRGSAGPGTGEHGQDGVMEPGTTSNSPLATPEGMVLSAPFALQLVGTGPEVHQACDKCHVVKGGYCAQEPIKPIPQLCFDCHENHIATHNYVHGPVAVGTCLFCHEPHQSVHRRLQRVRQPELCTQCHETGDYLASPIHVDALGKLCTECHNPHGAANQMLLINPG